MTADATLHQESESPHIVAGRQIVKTFRNGATLTPVLKSVDLAVRRGECVYLAGPSGSGKTTLLSIIGCILSPDEGEIEILGHEVADLNSAEKARFRRQHIGFMFQKFHLFRGLTAWENVRVAFDLQGVDGKYAVDQSKELLAAVGLSERANYHINQLSVGQCQRVALARALAGEPELILADEPTASLDARSGLTAMELLKNLCRNRGATCIVVTHDSRIYSFADRILAMEDGRFVEAKTY